MGIDIEEGKGQEVFLSIIIPIYKVERELECCIRSVLMQMESDMESLLVDDGSPDRCPEICDEYAKKDARIKVIHKKMGVYRMPEIVGCRWHRESM